MSDILDHNSDHKSITNPVKELIPVWIKVIGVLYILATIVYLLYHIPGLFSNRYYYHYLGLDPSQYYHADGIIIIIVTILGSFAAISLITGWKYALELALMHAIVQVGIALAVTLARPGMPLDIFILIPYGVYLRFLHIKKEKLLKEN